MKVREDNKTIISRIVRGVAANGFAQTISFVINFFSVPLFFRYWGIDLYGEWVMLSAIPTYLTMSDLSFGTTAGSEMTQLVARGERLKALKVLQSAWILVTFASLAILVLMLAVSHLVPLATLLKLSVISNREAVGILAVLLLGVCLAQQGGLIESVYRAAGFYAKGTFYMNLMRLFEFVVGVAVIVCKGDPWLYAVTLVVPKAICYTLFWIWYRKQVPWLFLGWSYADKETLKPLVSPALTFNAFNLGYAMNIQGMVILVGATFTPQAAALFSPMRTLTRVVLQGANAIASTIWQELSRAMGVGDRKLARWLHRSASQVGFWIVVPCLVLLYFVGPSLFRFWTGQDAFDYPLFGTLLLVTLLGSMWGISYVVPLSINKHQSTAITFFTTATCTIGLAWALSTAMGQLGAAIALAIGEAVMLVFVWRRSLSLLEDDFQGFIGQVLTPPLDLLRRFTRSSGSLAEEEEEDEILLPAQPEVVTAQPPVERLRADLSVVISAPSKYHFFELGHELHQRGMLSALFTGYPRFKLRKETELEDMLRFYPHFHLLYRAISVGIGRELEYVDRTVFDWLTSKNLPKCDVFMAIAASSLWTGRLAQKHGAAYVVDRPCSHIVVQNRLLQEEAKKEGIALRPIDPRVIQREVSEYEAADMVTVPSRFAYASFLEMGFPAEKLRVIPYGVNTSRFYPSGTPDPDSFDLVYVGLSSLRKGTPHLLRAFEAVNHPRKSLTIIGNINREVRGMLNQARAKSNVEALGHIPQEDLRKFMSRSHVLVLPSVEDGYGLVMSQAMACGTPVIASTHTGGDMIITEGEDGFIFTACDDDALIDRLQRLADDPDLRARMSANALLKARMQAGWSAYGDGIVQMFKDVRT
ncbi:MAG: glycosyltransferase [Armatimonadetes bacterium]|nr:glycosyltransferase [Armatimonadota bacterium]